MGLRFAVALILLHASAASAQIVLERTSCFGVCPAYDLTIRLNGSVTFTGGNRFAAPSGARQIQPESVDSLIAAIMRSGFVAMADSYKAGGPGCRAWGTDHPTIRLSVRSGLTAKTVSYDLGCYGDTIPGDSAALGRLFDHPSPSRELIERLAARVDSVAGVKEWLRVPRLGP